MSLSVAVKKIVRSAWGKMVLCTVLFNPHACCPRWDADVLRIRDKYTRRQDSMDFLEYLFSNPGYSSRPMR